MTILPCILAGGQGTRLWPASRPEHPKQYLPLSGERSLIRQTYDRVAALGEGVLPVVISIEAHDDLVQQELEELPRERIWLEPQGRNTGPSVAWALHEMATEHAGVVAAFFPADHHVADPEALRAAVRTAAAAATEHGGVALLGARPDRPETAYGHIEVGERLEEGVHRVTRFLEKPDLETARRLSQREDVLWNCGVFVVSVPAALDTVREVSPELAAFLDLLPAPASARRPGLPAREVLEQAFRSVEAVPFDIAVLERLARCLVVPVDAGWSDLGSWDAVWETGSKDASANVVSSGSVAVDTERCLVQSDGVRVAVLGVKDLVIVASGNDILICPRSRTQETRRLAEQLKKTGSKGGTDR